MKNICWFRYLWLMILPLAFLIFLAPASATTNEIYLTQERDSGGFGPELNDYLNAVQSKQGVILYSGCHDKYGINILIITNVLKHGFLMEFDGRKLGNVAPVTLKGYDGIRTEEMMGGMWVRNRAQNNVNQLVDMPFHIFSGKNPAELFDMRFLNKCKDYTGE